MCKYEQKLVELGKVNSYDVRSDAPEKGVFKLYFPLANSLSLVLIWWCKDVSTIKYIM